MKMYLILKCIKVRLLWFFYSGTTWAKWIRNFDDSSCTAKISVQSNALYSIPPLISPATNKKQRMDSQTFIFLKEYNNLRYKVLVNPTQRFLYAKYKTSFLIVLFDCNAKYDSDISFGTLWCVRFIHHSVFCNLVVLLSISTCSFLNVL